MDFSKSYEVTNQYGDIVRIFGSGIYEHDSYFKAPISIGTDFCILLVLVPLFICSYIRDIREDTNATRIRLMSAYAVALYYAASLAFGVTYNRLHLVYIALFACSLFGTFVTFRTIQTSDLNFTATKGIGTFLVLTGIALIVAWMPDIIPAMLSGEPLSLIEVYTTEITYVLDMGIIAPLCLVCVHLLNKKDNLGTVIFAILSTTCIFVGIMMIPQAICQMRSGYEMPTQVFVGKSGSFIALGGFALYFDRKLYSALQRNRRALSS